jgi:SAM-dependent methyltransferase
MNPAPRFDALARPYRWLELFSFGPLLMRARTFFLDQLVCNSVTMRRALVLGDGDGRFTALLLKALPGLEVDAVDASPPMLDALVKSSGLAAARLRTDCADVRGFEPPRPPYDLFVTHFFLDCLTTEEVAALALRLRATSRPGALWIVSEFAVPGGLYGRVIARPLVWLLYRVFAVLTGLRVRALPRHAEALAGAGFALAARRSWLGGLLTSELWRFEEVKENRGFPEVK